MHRFRKSLREARLRKKWTQAELGFRVNRDASFISKIERGVNAPPLDLVYRLAKVLNVEIEDLVK